MRERRDPLAQGTRIYDTVSDRAGTIVDVARQYAHPQAQPVFVYLLKWEDGQIQSCTEQALRSGYGIEVEADGADGR